MKKILIADDEPDIATVLQMRLQYWGYETIIAVDGQDCLDKIKSEKPDLVVLDIRMPKLNGHQVLSAVRELKEAGQLNKDLPIIVLTASVNPKIKGLIEQEHAHSFLTKPFKAPELLEKIKSILG
jgi:CheY-like chemotaxis protein